MQNLLEELKNLLSSQPRFTQEGRMIKQAVIDAAQSLDIEFLQLLLGHEAIKRHFFQDVGGILVFDKVKLLRFVSNKAFLEDSYTAFKNKIGLVTKNSDGLYDSFISNSKEVVLAYPYKDCMLEGGQTKEEQKRNEIFWNEILAPDDIDRLKAPKAFSNIKRYDSTGVHENITDLSLNDNYIIKGNNLLVLYSLLPVYRGKVKLIYIDPPYNNGIQTFGYNDSFNHSTWLTFMKDRLKIAHELLSEEGSIFINVDDKEAHYLKVLADEIFKRENFVSSIIWQKKHTRANDAKYFSDNHDHILVFAKKKETFELKLLPRTDDMNDTYSNPDNDNRGVWASQPIQVKTPSDDYIYELIGKTGKSFYPPKGRSWQFGKERYQELVADNRIYFGEKGDNVPRIKKFLSEVQDGLKAITIWPHLEVGHNQEAKEEIKELGFSEMFRTPKPERLIERIIYLTTLENDLILDFFAGSGTTGAVAMKMNRKFITCEQMDYAETITSERFRKVISGEQGGISKETNWQGGGSFVYAELSKANDFYIEQIEKSGDDITLLKIWQTMKAEAFISYKIPFDIIEKNISAYEALSLENKKKFLIETLDKNLLYVPYCDMESKDFGMNEPDKKATKAFYNLKT
jgi:adenine-specific DNA-methyltransferase